MPPILNWIALAILGLAFAGVLYQVLGSAADRREYPPPGRLIECGGTHWHVLESGAGPSVVLESGIAASCLNWTAVQREVARFARVVSYDRAGLGWSEPLLTARVTSRLTGELHALLAAAGIPAPYILVGHSFGGMLAGAYAAQYPGEVAGLVLVDPLPPSDYRNPTSEQAAMLGRGARLARRGELLARYGIVRASLALLTGGARRLPQLVASVSSGNGESTISRLVGEVRKMPPETWPAIRAHWSRPHSFRCLSGYLSGLPASSMEAAALGDPPPVPATILSAASATPSQIAERDAIAARSPNGKHIRARSGHWLHLDEPELVIQAIREMVDRAT